MFDPDNIREFFRKESAGGILLMFSAALAIVLANSPLHGYYDMLIDTVVAISIGDFDISKPLLLWVNDGMMAVFFLLIGLELKREFIEGELSDPKNIILPGLGAIGGMAVPAAIYVFINQDNPAALNGWAIPAATDIAFALGVLSLLGSRIPTSLKVFLTSLAIFDDVGAILIIAFFYTSHISGTALLVVSVCLAVLIYMNRSGVIDKSLYITIGVVMWVAMLKSGVHATLTGVLLAMFIPNETPADRNISPLKNLEYDLHAAVAFIILPFFAFCNSGINLRGVGMEQVLHGVPLGIALGLFIGKQLGVFGLCWIGVKLKLTELPADINWKLLYGAAALSGIGFTMSLFIGSLAFQETGVNRLFDERLGIIIGSLLSGILGYMVLRNAIKKAP